MVTHEISVIGGGLGGLAFAQGMRNLAGYQVTVYERDVGPLQRGQGYQIGLNKQGITALSSLNLSHFNDLIRENPLCGFMMTDLKLDPLIRIPIHNDKENPKSSLVNRWKLRDMLTTGLNIQWNKKFISYEERDDCVFANFEDGSSVKSSLIVGADGVSSKVREQYRPDLQFESTGITSIAGYFPMASDVNNELPMMKAIVMNHNLGRACLTNSNSLLFMKFIAADGNTNIIWSLSFQTDIAHKLYGDILTDDVNELRHNLMKRLIDTECSSELAKAIDLTPDENIMLPKETVSMKAIEKAHIRPPHLPPSNCRVVLIGDAAHAMTTHAGRGANTAFSDAIHLCNMLRTLHDPKTNQFAQRWPDAHAMFEEVMFKNGIEAVKVSMASTKRIHTVDNAFGLKFMRFIGHGFKFWNLITKGRYSLL